MPQKAALFDPSTGKFTAVSADRCTDADRGKPYVCPSCGGHAWLCKKKFFYFSGKHRSGCHIGDGGVILLPTMYHIDPHAVLSAVDCPIQDHPPTGTASPPPQIEFNLADYNPRLVRGPKTLRSAREYYNAFWSLPLDSPIHNDGKSTLGNLLVNSDTFEACRQSGIDGQIRLVKVRKTKWRSLPPALQVDGYLIFRDAYSKSGEDAMYFLVQLPEKTQHNYFFQLLTGKIGRRHKCPYLVLLGEWQRLPDCPCHAYFAQINSRCYHFVDDPL